MTSSVRHIKNAIFLVGLGWIGGRERSGPERRRFWTGFQVPWDSRARSPFSPFFLCKKEQTPANHHHPHQFLLTIPLFFLQVRVLVLLFGRKSRPTNADPHSNQGEFDKSNRMFVSISSIHRSTISLSLSLYLLCRTLLYGMETLHAPPDLLRQCTAVGGLGIKRWIMIDWLMEGGREKWWREWSRRSGKLNIFV